MSDRRSLWVERQRTEDAEHGPFSQARWRAQAARARRPVQEPPAEPPPAPPKRRFALVPALALFAAIVALALAGVALLDDGSTPKALAPATVSGGKPLPQGIVGRVYEAAGPGVVSVQAGNATGTGFVVARDGTIVTNNHVVGENETAQVRFDDSGRQVRGAGARHRPLLRPRRAAGRSRRGGGAAPARARRLRQRAGRRRRRRDRPPVRARSHGHLGHRLRHSGARSRRPTASRSTT